MSFDAVTYAAAFKKSKEYTDSVINKGVPCGYVTNGGSFPTTRPDGTALQDEDYVRPLASSTFPFTIATVTFDNRFATAIYSSALGIWIGNPGVIQDTSETPLKNPTAEQIESTDATQAQYNISAKAKFDTKLDKATDTVSIEHAYIHKADGTDSLMQININANAGLAIVRRDLDKQINVPLVPVSDEDAASKQYVDTSATPDNVTIDRSAVDQKLQVKDAGITAVKLATDAVETAKIKDDNVTIAKIADANISTAIPSTGAVDTKLATEKAVADYVDTADIDSFAYDNTNEKFSIEFKKPDGTTTTKDLLASSITAGVVTQTATQTLTNKTVDADNNTVSNLETDNLKAGVLDTTAFSIADDTHIPSSKLVDAKIKDAISAIIKFVGYVSATEPAGTIKTGAYWYESAVTEMPTAFPIQVHTYNGAAWTTTTSDYTPSEWEAWINKNTNKEYYYSGGLWNQIDFTVAADNITIDKNASGELQIKDGGVSLVKFADALASDEGKGYLINNLGKTVIDNIKQYKRVSTFAGEAGNSHTVYVLDTPYSTFAAGLYVWDAVNGFVSYSGTGGGPMFIGLVTNGSTFPVLRPDSSPLVLGDYVKASSTSTFPFTIGSVTFSSVKDQAVYLGYMNWQLNASPYQSTIEVSVNDAATESLGGLSLYQNTVNAENVVALKDRPTKANVGLRKDSTAYAYGDRVLYPGKYSYVLVCAMAGTTSSSLPAWPASITSGVTSISDGSAMWTVYDMSKGGVQEDDIPLHKTSKAYTVGARVLYPGKYGYMMQCSVPGTTSGIRPAWPSSIVSGLTELFDGIVRWTIYDLSAIGSLVRVYNGVIAAGNLTTTISVPPSNQIISTSAKTNTGENVLLDTQITTGLVGDLEVKFTIAEAQTYAINCEVAFASIV